MNHFVGWSSDEYGCCSPDIWDFMVKLIQASEKNNKIIQITQGCLLSNHDNINTKSIVWSMFKTFVWEYHATSWTTHENLNELMRYMAIWAWYRVIQLKSKCIKIYHFEKSLNKHHLTFVPLWETHTHTRPEASKNGLFAAGGGPEASRWSEGHRRRCAERLGHCWRPSGAGMENGPQTQLMGQCTSVARKGP